MPRHPRSPAPDQHRAEVPAMVARLGQVAFEQAVGEVLEECDAEVEIGRLAIVWEYVPAKENFRYGTQHKVGLIYEAHLQPGQEPDLTHRYDSHQTGVRWLPLERLLDAETINVFGARLLEVLLGTQKS